MVPSIFRVLYHFVNTKFFDNVIMFVIIANTAVMSFGGLDFYEHNDQIFKSIDLFFISMFIVEMALLLIVYGFKGYVKDSMNVFNGFLVILSIIDFSMTSSINLDSFRSLRILRVLRVTRLLSSLKYITVIIKAV